MVEILQITLLLFVILFSIVGFRLSERLPLVVWMHRIVIRKRLIVLSICCVVLMGCFTMAGRVAQAFAFFAKAGDVHSSHQIVVHWRNVSQCLGD